MATCDSNEVSEYTFDFGGHVHPERTAPEPIRQLNSAVGSHHTDVAELARWYEDAGVDGAALSQPFYIGHGDPNRTTDANDALLEDIDDHSNLYGLAAIPTAAGGDTAAREFERCLENGYAGGALETKSDGIELTDPAVEPILKVADRTGAPLLVHPKLDDSVHPDALDETYRLNAIFGREVALCESLCKVIHDGVLERYPNLTLVYHHLGGNVASMLGRVHVQLDPGRWPNQEATVGFDEFEQTLADRIHIDTCGFFGYAAPIRAALEVFPPSQILFATDAPYEPRSPNEVRTMATTVEEVTPESASHRILGENALDLLS
ncbi:amidohydrolase family protein [Halostagnicola sp. A-GB9-2]|uniref:amidohydrolase family protein n=1 Tax=Halostagnicola sp. A-GB9-2 TaxID=3048066 RepID=UPI0024C0A171|nr:amidohydrolase family protein [Halostagnicola sp. A-GB9-2]MDJ1433831.1 amidohydrolase family protein [Halostagnicola sp. A-GB9-2]